VPFPAKMQQTSPRHFILCPGACCVFRTNFWSFCHGIDPRQYISDLSLLAHSTHCTRGTECAEHQKEQHKMGHEKQSESFLHVHTKMHNMLHGVIFEGAEHPLWDH
jgi:hypothetical protein